MSDVSSHWEDTERISPPVDTPTDRSEAETEGIQVLVVSTIWYGNSGVKIGRG